MKLNDLLRGFREMNWWLWLIIGWAAISIVASLSTGHFSRAFEWAASLATWLVIIYFYGIICRLQDQLERQHS